MDSYKDRANLMYSVYRDQADTAEAMAEAYMDISMSLESMHTPQDLWAYLAVEQKKADMEIDSDKGYDNWSHARARKKALINAEKWLRKVEERENGE